MNNLNIIELFSGIGGFTKGFKDAGYTISKHYFSEIDKHAIANYKYNFPDAEYIGSVVDIRPDNFRDIDIITFGSPCQDFSLAGKRKGLEGDRSSLIQYAINLISHIRPSVFIWENVKGAFSSNAGADFWAILQAFANIGGYRLEWQLLNTKWFLPQNRERIYLVGHFANRSEPGVFPITENDKIYNSGRQIKKETNGCASALMANHFQSQRGNFVDVKTLQGSDTLNTIRSGGRGSLTDKHSWDIVQIGAFRGRNPDNPSQRIAGQYQEQTLELNENGVANTLSTVQKDNVVISHYGHKNKTAKISEICPTLKAESHGHEPMTNVGLNIRRLTEIECERLQGFPDNFTEYGNYDGIIKKIPKTQRYKMLGNAVTVKVVEEVAKRLKLNL